MRDVFFLIFDFWIGLKTDRGKVNIAHHGIASYSGAWEARDAAKHAPTGA